MNTRCCEQRNQQASDGSDMHATSPPMNAAPRASFRRGHEGQAFGSRDQGPRDVARLRHASQDGPDLPRQKKTAGFSSARRGRIDKLASPENVTQLLGRVSVPPAPMLVAVAYRCLRRALISRCTWARSSSTRGAYFSRSRANSRCTWPSSPEVSPWSPPTALTQHQASNCLPQRDLLR